MTSHDCYMDFTCQLSNLPVPKVMAPSIGPIPPLQNFCKLITVLITVNQMIQLHCFNSAKIQKKNL